jgi:YD repeat-containing protein
LFAASKRTSSRERQSNSPVGLNYRREPLRLCPSTETYNPGSEVFNYDYDAYGNRSTRQTPAGTETASQILHLFEVRQVTGSSAQSYGYDSGGRLNCISRPGQSLTLTYDSLDRLKTVAGLTYSYDGVNRRVKSTGTSLGERRFVVGPTAATDLEVIHMVTDASGNVKAVYVYAGNQPLLRFGVDGNGNPEPTTLVYYLEDAMGSIVGLANRSGTVTAKFRYDGFGNGRSGTGLSDPFTSSIPTGVGGDFRFHGAWLETTTKLYHMRAREGVGPRKMTLSDTVGALRSARVQPANS